MTELPEWCDHVGDRFADEPEEFKCIDCGFGFQLLPIEWCEHCSNYDRRINNLLERVEKLEGLIK